MTSAAGSVGAARAALEVAAMYSTKRQAFGRPIRKFQAVSFMVANSVAKLDAARSLVYTAARYTDAGLDSRRLVSEAKKVATEMGWEVINNAMQIMGGIGYTNIYPIERYLRDGRLSMIWTGTSEIMNGLIQHEYYHELTGITDRRNIEEDATAEKPEAEKIYT
jgi:acyl-CoA dehydrogenase